jgi:DNA-binding NarL/FixJ family response regulator
VGARDGAAAPEPIAAYGSAAGAAPVADAPAGAALSERENQVLRALASGASNKQAARELGISDRTVQSHTIHIYAKLGVRTRTEAVLVAMRQGWLQGASERSR